VRITVRPRHGRAELVVDPLQKWAPIVGHALERVVFQISIAADFSWNRGTFRATGSGVRSSDHDGMAARCRRRC
jgi:hypothetical protein